MHCVIWLISTNFRPWCTVTRCGSVSAARERERHSGVSRIPRAPPKKEGPSLPCVRVRHCRAGFLRASHQLGAPGDPFLLARLPLWRAALHEDAVVHGRRLWVHSRGPRLPGTSPWDASWPATRPEGEAARAALWMVPIHKMQMTLGQLARKEEMPLAGGTKACVAWASCSPNGQPRGYTSRAMGSTMLAPSRSWTSTVEKTTARTKASPATGRGAVLCSSTRRLSRGPWRARWRQRSTWSRHGTHCTHSCRAALADSPCLSTTRSLIGRTDHHRPLAELWSRCSWPLRVSMTRTWSFLILIVQFKFFVFTLVLFSFPYRLYWALLSLKIDITRSVCGFSSTKSWGGILWRWPVRHVR